jgi:hypothetical protein
MNHTVEQRRNVMNKNWIQLMVLVGMVLYGSQAQAYYNPQAGRFIQRDPLGYADGMNLYEYVRGNPPRYTDATGSFSAEIAASADLNPEYQRDFWFYGGKEEHIIQKVDAEINYYCDKAKTCAYRVTYYEAWILSKNGIGYDKHRSGVNGILHNHCSICCDETKCANPTFNVRQSFTIYEGGKIDIQKGLPPEGMPHGGEVTRFTYLAKYNNGNAPCASVWSDGKDKDATATIKKDYMVDISSGFTATGGNPTKGIIHHGSGIIGKSNDGKCQATFTKWPNGATYK